MFSPSVASSAQEENTSLYYNATPLEQRITTHQESSMAAPAAPAACHQDTDGEISTSDVEHPSTGLEHASSDADSQHSHVSVMPVRSVSALQHRLIRAYTSRHEHHAWHVDAEFTLTSACLPSSHSLKGPTNASHTQSIKRCVSSVSELPPTKHAKNRKDRLEIDCPNVCKVASCAKGDKNHVYFRIQTNTVIQEK